MTTVEIIRQLILENAEFYFYECFDENENVKFYEYNIKAILPKKIYPQVYTCSQVSLNFSQNYKDKLIDKCLDDIIYFNGVKRIGYLL